ncbi:MAG TPA: hypothetical protein VFG35_28810, partial [Actinoplanes sp.]|nr:hypothetical protein [Actinoplanes sp.]
PTDALPTDALPTDALPTEALPAEALPTEALPTEALPTEALPTEARPGETAPGEALPTEARPGVPGEAEPTAPRPPPPRRYASGAARADAEEDGDWSSSGVEPAAPGTWARARGDCGSPYGFMRSHLGRRDAHGEDPGGALTSDVTRGRFGLHTGSRPDGCHE